MAARRLRHHADVDNVINTAAMATASSLDVTSRASFSYTGCSVSDDRHERLGSVVSVGLRPLTLSFIFR